MTVVSRIGRRVPINRYRAETRTTECSLAEVQSAVCLISIPNTFGPPGLIAVRPFFNLQNLQVPSFLRS